MVAPKFMRWKDELIPPKRLWTARHWRYLLSGGDTFVVFLAFTYYLGILMRGKDTLHSAYELFAGGWISFLQWEGIACLSWMIGIHLVQSHAHLYSLRYRQGVFAGYCSLLVMVGFLFIFLLTFFHGTVSFALQIVFPFILLVCLLFGLWRACYAALQKFFLFQPLVVMIGTGELSDEMMVEFCQAGKPVPSLLGCISESICCDRYSTTCPVLGGSAALHLLMQSNLVDMLIVTTDISTDTTFYHIVQDALTRGILVFTLSDFYEYTTGKRVVPVTNDLILMSFYESQVQTLAYRCWHCLLDFCFGVLGTCVLGVLLPLLALCIFLDSPGPIFYWQERVGYRGRPFRLLKFRSMCLNAEPYGATWASSVDARVTRVGRILRSTHLDELPQVLNILRGDMSLIGPRPEREPFVSQLEQAIPSFHYRLSVKPGLTGWAQVKFPYASSYEDAVTKLRYDLYYIKHRSLILDVSILFRTVIKLMWGTGR